MQATYSRKVIAEWSDGWTVRLYSDRAIAHVPYVKWTGNTGILSSRTHRITGTVLEQLKEIAAQQAADAADYTDRVWQLVNEVDYWC